MPIPNSIASNVLNIKQVLSCTIDNQGLDIHVKQSLCFTGHGIDWFDFGGTYQQPMLGLPPLYAKNQQYTGAFAWFDGLGRYHIAFSTGSLNDTDSPQNYTLDNGVSVGTNTEDPRLLKPLAVVSNYANYGIKTLIPANFPYQAGYPTQANYVSGDLQIPNQFFPKLNSIFSVRYVGNPATKGQIVILCSAVPLPLTPYVIQQVPQNATTKITLNFDASVSDFQTAMDATFGSGNVSCSGNGLLHITNLFDDGTQADGGNSYLTMYDDANAVINSPPATPKLIGKMKDGEVLIEFTGLYAGTRITFFEIIQLNTNIDILPVIKFVQFGSMDVDSFGGQFSGQGILTNGLTGAPQTFTPIKTIPAMFITPFDHLDVRVFSNFINWLMQLNDWHGWGYPSDFFVRVDGLLNEIVTQYETYGSTNYVVNGLPINMSVLLEQIQDFIISICEDQFGCTVGNCPVWAPTGGFFFGTSGIVLFPDAVSGSSGIPFFPPTRGDWNFTNYKNLGATGKYNQDDFTSLLPFSHNGPTVLNAGGVNSQSYPFYVIGKTVNQSVVKPFYSSFTYSTTVDCSAIDFPNVTHFSILPYAQNTTPSSTTLHKIRPIADFSFNLVLRVLSGYQIMGTPTGRIVSPNVFQFDFIFVNFGYPQLIQFGVLNINGGLVTQAGAAFAYSPYSKGSVTWLDNLDPSNMGYFVPEGPFRAVDPSIQVWFEMIILYKVTQVDEGHNVSGTFVAGAPFTTTISYQYGGAQSSKRFANALTADDLTDMHAECISNAQNFTITGTTNPVLGPAIPRTVTFEIVTTVHGSRTFTEESINENLPVPNSGLNVPTYAKVFWTGDPEAFTSYDGTDPDAKVAWNTGLSGGFFGSGSESTRIDLVHSSQLNSIVQTQAFPFAATVAYNGANGLYGGTPGGTTIAKFFPSRQDVNDISVADVRSSPEVAVYSSTIANISIGTQIPAYFIGSMGTGWTISNQAVVGVLPGSPTSSQAILGTYKKQYLAFCIDTRGKTIRQAIGLKVLETSFNKMILSTLPYVLIQIQSQQVNGVTQVNEKSFLWLNTNTQNFQSYFDQNLFFSSFYPGGGATYRRNFTGKIKISYGSVTGNLRRPLNTTTLDDDNLTYLPQLPQQGSYQGSFSSNPPSYVPGTYQVTYQLDYNEVRNQQMIDGMIASTRNTTVLDFEFDETFLPDLHAPNPQLPTVTSSNLAGLSDYQPRPGEIVCMLVEVSMVPTVVSSFSTFMSDAGITKYGPSLDIEMSDGFAVGGIGQSTNAQNSTPYKFIFGGLQLDVQNRLYQ